MRKYATVIVEGDSMEPTYSSGDWLMAKWSGFGLRYSTPKIREAIGAFLGRRLSIGEVAVIERPEYPGIYYVKRLSEIREDTHQIYVLSDNPDGNDSRQWGWLPASSIQAKVVSRVRKAKKK